MGLFEQPHKQQQQLHVLGASSAIAASACDKRSIEGFEAVLWTGFGVFSSKKKEEEEGKTTFGEMATMLLPVRVDLSPATSNEQGESAQGNTPQGLVLVAACRAPPTRQPSPPRAQWLGTGSGRTAYLRRPVKNP